MLHIFAALLLAAAPAPTLTPGPEILGVTLGAPLRTALAQRGDPLRIDAPAGAPAKYYYLYGSPIFEQILTVYQGRVRGIEIREIPGKVSVDMQTFGFDGLRIGDSQDAVAKAGGESIAILDDGSYDWLIVKSNYGLHATVKEHVVTALAASYGHQEDLRVSPVSERVTIHGGTSYADAIVIKTDNPRVGGASQTYFLSAHPCAKAGMWQKPRRTTQHHGTSAYDVVTATCSTDGSKRTFYFDISSYFGKPDTLPQ